MTERYAELRAATQETEKWALGDRLDAAGALAYKRAWERYHAAAQPSAVAALLTERDDLEAALRHGMLRDHPDTSWCDGCMKVRAAMKETA